MIGYLRVMSVATVGLVLALLVSRTSTLSADVPFSKSDADRFVLKVVQINANATQSGGSRSTPVTEAEVNAFLRYHAQPNIPAGVVDPYVTILGARRVSGRAVVDLDKVRQAQNAKGWLDPASYLTGKVPVTATGLLHTNDGVGRLEIQSAEVGGISVPKTLLQQVVSYYSRSDERPKGINLDDPFDLPADIREIRVEPGKAVVVQ